MSKFKEFSINLGLLLSAKQVTTAINSVGINNFDNFGIYKRSGYVKLTSGGIIRDLSKFCSQEYFSPQ